jgi:hypothetical protein
MSFLETVRKDLSNQNYVVQAVAFALSIFFFLFFPNKEIRSRRPHHGSTYVLGATQESKHGNHMRFLKFEGANMT